MDQGLGGKESIHFFLTWKKRMIQYSVSKTNTVPTPFEYMRQLFK